MTPLVLTHDTLCSPSSKCGFLSVARMMMGCASGSEDESSGIDVMEGEKENEDISNDGGSSTTSLTPHRNNGKNNMQTNKAAGVLQGDYLNLYFVPALLLMCQSLTLNFFKLILIYL